MPPPEQPPTSTPDPNPGARPAVTQETDHDTNMSDQSPAKQPDVGPLPPTETHQASPSPESLAPDAAPTTDHGPEKTKAELSPAPAPAAQEAGAEQGHLRDARGQGQIDDVPPPPPAKDEPAVLPGQDGQKAPEAPLQAREAATEHEPMESSVATLKPHKPQYLTIKTPPYVDPTPPTPTGSQPPSRTNSAHRSKANGAAPSPTRSDAGYDEQQYGSEDEQEGEGTSRSEIQNIMGQFPEEGGGPNVDEVMSPRLEIASPFLGSVPAQHPPRKSSLEPLAPSIAHQIQEMQGLRLASESPASVRSRPKEREGEEYGPPVPPKDGPSEDKMPSEGPMSPTSSAVHRPPPPDPEPEPSLPFDFHRFLEQLQKKKADPVARYLKSFLQEFAKRQWMVHEQVKIIGDFLAFIANKMAQCDVWRDVSDAEFDNAREGMEKLVMNRLYTQTFSPAIPPPQPIPGAKPRRRGGDRPMGPGRRGQHQEDVERDEVLAQKINIYGWVREEHLDIQPVNEGGKRFLTLAQQGEFPKPLWQRRGADEQQSSSKSNLTGHPETRSSACSIAAKLYLVWPPLQLNSPLLTGLGLLKNQKSDGSADSFMPLLIYVVLQCNPDHLVSNVQYILRFRNQEKLGGEAGYYLSSLVSLVSRPHHTALSSHLCRWAPYSSSRTWTEPPSPSRTKISKRMWKQPFRPLRKGTVQRSSTRRQKSSQRKPECTMEGRRPLHGRQWIWIRRERHGGPCRPISRMTVPPWPGFCGQSSDLCLQSGECSPTIPVQLGPARPRIALSRMRRRREPVPGPVWIEHRRRRRQGRDPHDYSSQHKRQRLDKRVPRRLKHSECREPSTTTWWRHWQACSRISIGILLAMWSIRRRAGKFRPAALVPCRVIANWMCVQGWPRGGRMPSIELIVAPILYKGMGVSLVPLQCPAGTEPGVG